ncbi:MAG: hypothetical protein ABH849_02230 [Nanoarchaeota archaeon]
MASKIGQGKELAKGIIFGGAFCTGKRTIPIGPPIIPFLHGMGRIKNNLLEYKDKNLDSAELNHLINSNLDNLIADTLIFFENRLKIMAAKNKFPNLSFNSIPKVKKAYGRIMNIDLSNLTNLDDFNFLIELDKERGKKHHKNERYLPQCSIGNLEIKSVKDIMIIVNKVETIIKSYDDELEKVKPTFKITQKKEGNKIVLEMQSLNHSYDLLNNKINPKKQS